MRLVILALLAPIFVAGCNSTPYNIGPDAPAENASTICSARTKPGSDAYFSCYAKEIQAAKMPCNIGSGMDAVVSIQKGTAKCPSGGQAYATARNNPAGYSTVIMAKP